MPLPSGRLPILGVGLYGVGLAVYGASWLALVWWPNSAWSQGVLGFTAPAYTAIFWLLGIAFVGRQLYLNIPYRWWVYVILSTLFTGVHVAHAVLVFNRTARQ
jgi:hypothetical protein